jgi:predicted transcriptional regulator
MKQRSPRKTKPRYLEPRTNKQYDTQRRVLDALAEKRRHPERPITSIAHNVGTTVKTIRRYIGGTLENRGGRIEVKATDRISRAMRMLTTDGEQIVIVHNSRDATRIAKHNNAVKTALYSFGTDRKALERFTGKTVRTGGKIYTFVTDYDQIIHLTRAGAVHFLDIYSVHTAA